MSCTAIKAYNDGSVIGDTEFSRRKDAKMYEWWVMEPDTSLRIRMRREGFTSKTR